MSGYGSGAWSAFRSYREDAGVAGRRLAPGTVRRVLSYAAPYRRQIAALLTLVVFGALLVVATPLLLKRIIDEGVAHGNRSLVVSLAALVALVALFEAAITLLQRWFSARIGEGLIFDLRSDVFSHVQRQSIAFFTRSQTGSLVTRLNSDVVGAERAFTSTISGVASNVISVVVVLATMLVLSWQVTLVALAVVPVFLLPARRVGRRLAGLARESMAASAELGTRMTERFNVAGALLVALFGDPAREDAEFATRAARVRDVGIRTAMSSRIFFAALGAMASLATALVYGFGGLMAVAGSVTVGSLVAFAALLGRLYGPIAALSNVQVDVMTAFVSFERVFEVLDLRPAIEEGPDDVDLPAGPLRLDLEDVWFRYPSGSPLESLESTSDHRAAAGAVLNGREAGRGGGEEMAAEAGERDVLRGVTLSVQPGQMVALVGPSGAGKTTVGALIARLYDPTAGTVRIGGVDLRRTRPSSIRAAVGVVTQDAHMFHDTVRANLLYAKPAATDVEIASALAAARVDDVVRRLPQGLDTVVGDRGHRLSGGEKQRLAIARLLLRAPRVVVLDEATAHLDSESEATVQRALDEAMSGRTSVVIAHRLSTVRRAAAIVVLDRGRVVDTGTHAELLVRGGLYAELYNRQFAVEAEAR